MNHKKVRRMYRELDLTVKRTRRKHLRRTFQPRPVLTAPNPTTSGSIHIEFPGRAIISVSGADPILVRSILESLRK